MLPVAAVPPPPIDMVIARILNPDLNGDALEDVFNHVAEGFQVLDNQRKCDVRALRNEKNEVARNVDGIRVQVNDLQEDQRRLKNDVAGLKNRAQAVQQQNAAIVVPAAAAPDQNLQRINRVAEEHDVKKNKKAEEKRLKEEEANRIRECFKARIISCDNAISYMDPVNLIVWTPMLGVEIGLLLLFPAAAIIPGAPVNMVMSTLLLGPTSLLEISFIAKGLLGKRRKGITIEQQRKFEDYLNQKLTPKLALELAKKV